MLDINNVVRITTLLPGARLGNANTSALALVTHDDPLFPNFGEFRVYKNPKGVAADFGANSRAAKMANIAFAQVPNLTSGNGYLIVIPLLGNVPDAPAVITLGTANLINLPKELAITLNVSGETQTLIMTDIDNTTTTTLQNTLNRFLNTVGVVANVSGNINSADITLTTTAVGANASLSIIAAQNSDYSDLAALLDAIGLGAIGANNGEEQLKEAILRTIDKVFYFAVMFDEISDLPYSNSRFKEVAQLMQALDKLLFVCTNLRARVTDNFQAIADGNFTHTRCLFYGGTMEDALLFMAAYASRALSVNYNLANSALTMNLKTLTGIGADKSIDQTFYDTLQKAGVDFYGDFGVAKVISNGANGFYDDVANILALKLDVQVDRFNSLGTTPTKIKQTDEGMDFLNANTRKVLQKYVDAGVLAPGAWNSSTFYGNQEKHIASIRQLGYWVYSPPVAEQSQAEREKRITPPTYIAAKAGGAFHESDVVILWEA